MAQLYGVPIAPILRPQMRIRILKASTGIMDGVSLSYLVPGSVYEVPVSLGTWLIAKDAAEADVNETLGVVIPLDRHLAIGGISVPSPGTDRADCRATGLLIPSRH